MEMKNKVTPTAHADDLTFGLISSLVCSSAVKYV